MNNKTKEDVQWLVFWAVVISLIFIVDAFLPDGLRPEPKRPTNYQRVVVLQDGTRIKTSLFQISQWTFGTGVSIGDNHYAGNYSILIDEGMSNE